MSKPDPDLNPKGNLMQLERELKAQIRELWHATAKKQYDKRQWSKFQTDFESYMGHVRKILGMP